jgi:predicted membrane GTPase involved in stress response
VRRAGLCPDRIAKVTPTAIRLRKRILAANQRPKKRSED